MKANELSVGDWVCAKMMVLDGEERLTPPMRVVAIGETWVHLLSDPEAGDPDEYDIEDIRPVPLTADIMFENFIEWQTRTDRYEFAWSCSAEKSLTHEISIIRRDVHWHCTFREYVWPAMAVTQLFNSVHELQHALRLAGIENEIKL